MNFSPAILRQGKQRGLMLIMVLWVITILSLLMYSLLYTLTLETVLTSTRKKSLQAEAVARAGIARGMVDLRNDMIVDFTDDDDPPFDGEGDFWADAEEGKFEEEFGEGEYTVEIIDLDRYFNLNAIGGANKIILEKIIMEIGFDEDDAKVVAAAIVDYADSDFESLQQDGGDGEEGMVYGRLRAEDLGLSTREDNIEEMILPNQPYLSVEGLLDVYGVTPELFFGPESPEAEHYRRILGTDKKYSKGAFEMENKRRSRLEEGPPKGLRDYFRTRASNTLNLNTAEQHVLTALFLAAGRSDGERAAEDLIKRRRGGRSRRIDNDNMFKSRNDFQSDGALSGIISAADAVYPLGVTSNDFTIRSVGTVRGVQKELQLTVSRAMLTVQRDEDFESLDRARDREERFEGRRDRWQDREAEQVIRIPSVYTVRWDKI